MATWTSNVGGDEVIAFVTVEEDDGVFLSFADDGPLDLMITDDFEAQTFFDEVAKAKVEWDRRKKNG